MVIDVKYENAWKMSVQYCKLYEKYIDNMYTCILNVQNEY